MTKDTRARYTFRLPNTLLEKIKHQAYITGVSSNALILQILWDWIEQDKKGANK